MSVPANMMNFAGLPPISREIDPQIQAWLLAQRLGIPVPPPPGLEGPPPPASLPAGPAPAQAAPAAPAPDLQANQGPPQPMPGNVPYRTGMAPQQAAPSTPMGAILNPAAGRPVNPFEGPPEPTPTIAQGDQGPPAPTGDQKPQRLQRWKDFIQRFKTDPDTRMAVFQATLALTQPNDNPAASIGNALGTGVRTMEALRTQKIEEGRATRAEGREERQVATQEGGLAQRRTEAQQEYELKLKDLEQSKAYQTEYLKIQRLEAEGKTGESGQVNQRWSMLTSAILADPTPDLIAITDPAKRQARARVKAFDLMTSAGQTRQKFIADLIAKEAMLSDAYDPTDPKYAENLQKLVGRATAYADAAGLFDERAAPQGAPAAAAALPQGITEEQVNHTMRKYNLTREQVLARLAGG